MKAKAKIETVKVESREMNSRIIASNHPSRTNEKYLNQNVLRDVASARKLEYFSPLTHAD